MGIICRIVFGIVLSLSFLPNSGADTTRPETLWENLPAHCQNDKECLIELPGAYCADGTRSFFTLTKRAKAKNLLIYFRGGGACWSPETCDAGYARVLTRKETATDWTNGKGIHDSQDPNNPFRKNYHVVTIPYCTGDAFTGNRVVDYLSDRAPRKMHHVGYQNAVLTLQAAKALYPSPERVAIVGCSAGGIGAYYHLRNLADAFPSAKKYVISDAGTPFRPPYVDGSKYQQIMKVWGADRTLPQWESGHVASHFGEVWQYNKQFFPDVKFGFISSYGDKTMSFFAWTLGATAPFAAVKKTIIEAADQDLGNLPYGKVFYTQGTDHCHTPKKLSDSTSTKTNLGEWLTAMVSDDSTWENQRPDESRQFNFEEPNHLPTLEEIQSENFQ